MLKIALCDDQQQSRESISALLAEYTAAELSLTTYTQGLDLLKQLEWDGKELYDLYLLDVLMPQLSGIELGRRLRSMGIMAPIIYLTSSRDYAVESYNVRAFHYLLKPITKEKLFAVLAQAQKRIDKSKANAITVHTHDGTVLLRVDDILYAELYARAVRYHLANGTVIDSQKLRISFQKAVADLLRLRSFIMVGSSFLVNLHQVKKIGHQELLLANGQSLPLPKGAKGELLNSWMDYWLATEAP